MNERITPEQVAENGEWIERPGNQLVPEWLHRLSAQMKADAKGRERLLDLVLELRSVLSVGKFEGRWAARQREALLRADAALRGENNG